MSSPPFQRLARPSLVCFDLGGVVVRICRSWAEGCEAAGVARRDDDDDDVEIGGTRLGDIVRDHHTGRIDLPTYAGRMSQRLDGRYRPEEIAAVHGAWILGEYDGVRTIIEALPGLGIETAALSNTNAEHWAQLPGYPAFRAIRRPLGSHELGLVKPEPEVYRRAEEHLGVRGGSILFFDDSPENVDAARAAGWRAVRIDPLAETAPQIRQALAEAGVRLTAPSA